MSYLQDVPSVENGQELCWKNVLTERKLDSMFERDRFVNPNRLFYSINGVLPNKNNYYTVDKVALFKELRSQYQLGKDRIIKVQYFNVSTEAKNSTNEKHTREVFGSIILLIRKDLLVYFCPDKETGKVEILYSADIDKSEKQKLIDIIYSFPKKEELKNRIDLVCQDENKLRIEEFYINPPKIDLKKNYNDDFIKVHETIIKRLHTENDKGIVLLHGKPGTGKTTYLRLLLSLTKKRTIYVPPDFAQAITSPAFMSFLIQFPNSILVIEDAENVIEQRKGGDSGAISNLLNLSDGLLSDCLNIQLICSFNNDISKIDKALMRKGRMIAKYEFKELSVEKAQVLSDSLGYKIKIDKPMALAEIYNQSDETFDNTVRKKIGF